MRIILTIFTICIALYPCHSQMKYSYRSYNFVGLLEGQRGTSFSLSTIHGVYAKKMFAGIGTGLDYYGIRTIPLFLATTYFAGKNENILLRLNGGLGYVWDKNNPVSSSWNAISNDYKTKPFYDAAIGYKIPSKKGYQGVILGAGYSLKKIQFRENYNTACLNPPCPVETNYYDYIYRRLAIHLGYVF